MNPLIGKKLVAVYVAENKGSIRFDVEGGEPIIARADGDCCSSTWIEAVESPAHCLGGTVTSVDDIPMPEQPYDELEYELEQEYLKFYGCRIATDRGHFVIDYRNSSNGYYGGSLVWDDDHFYGGVYGQNGKDTNDWREVK